MKTIWLLLLTLTLAFNNAAQAQDKLLLRTGDEKLVKVLEISPDSVFYITSSDSAQAKPPLKSLPTLAIFSITYQNGTRTVMPEPTPAVAPLSSAAYYAYGRADARKYYKAGGAFWATFGSTLVLPLGGPLLSLGTGTVVTLVNVPDKKIIASDPAFKQNLHYLKGYQKQAKNKKLGNAAAGLGAGSVLLMGVLAYALSTY